MPSERLHTFWITCADGLETLLVNELQGFGAHIVSRQPGRILIENTLEIAYHTCLWSRLASRVLLPIHYFTPDVKNEHVVRDIAEELYEGAVNFDWSLVFSTGATFAVRLHTERDIRVNTQFATLRVKDGIVDAFMDSQGRRPSIDTHQPEITLTAFAGLEQHVYSLDLSGDSLHRRGYRQLMTDAPLKENLAAAIMQLAQNNQPFNTLIDPMCGSGTLIIEALLMYTDCAAGLNRNFGFMGWSGHDATLWNRLHLEAEQRFAAGLARPRLAVFAFDADWRALQATRHNLIAAGLADYLTSIRLEERTLADWCNFAQESAKMRTLETDDLSKTPPEPMQALLVTNPPYGERLGDKATSRALYQGLGRQLQKALSGQRAAVIAAQIEQADVLPLADTQTTRLMNGNLPIYVRAGTVLALAELPMSFLQQWTPQPVIDSLAQDFANRLQKNLLNLKKIALREQVSNLRIYDADLPDYNLAIDLYGSRVHVQEYAPPKTIDPEKAKQRFNTALHIIRQVLNVQREQVFIKTRARQKGSEQYEKKGDTGKRFIVHEGAADFYINLTDYLDTGLFLDHRPMRERIAKEARGKHFLNLYAYTCTVSVHAALGGAASTTSVDLSNTYLDWGKNNFALNGLTVDHSDEQHQFFAGDVFEWLKEGSEQYDLIFIDPPTFSNSKKFFGTFDVQRDHASLLKRAMNRLAPEGVLYFSNNFKRFAFDDDLFERFDIQDITPQTIGFDFKRHANIHQAWALRHLK